MLGIGCPDRHALPRVTSIKCTDRELRSPPARAGSFFGAPRPLPRITTKVRLVNRPPTLDLAGRDYSSCPIPDLETGSAIGSSRHNPVLQQPSPGQGAS